MEVINARFANVKKTEKTTFISIYSKKPISNNSLYENIKIVIDNNILTLEGLFHKQHQLFSFDTQKHWIEDVYPLPLPEDEYLIKEGYKGMFDKWKGIKSKYIDNFKYYTYEKEFRKLICNNFNIEFQTENVLETKEDLKSFTEFIKDK